MSKRKFGFIFLIVLIIVGNYTAGIHPAKAEDADTATLQIIATGDLHGQTTAFNYETGQAIPDKGLSKIATLVQEKEQEAGSNNTLLVDAGDFLYDYTSNYFYDNYRDSIQPIMRAMSIMDYDYITLGNHEFDYPLDYLRSQLKRSGLSDKVLVCNTIWHDSGKQVFNPSAIAIKYLNTSGGKVIPVRIGIIGATTNTISARRGDYVNEIDALNNYDSIVAEADRLKTEEKVDAVVVILHGGIGAEKPAKSSENVGYALTKVASIDAVVTAHTHDTFPDISKTGEFNQLGQVDLVNGCINGKPVLATSSHASAFGTINLNFNISQEGNAALSGGNASIYYVMDSTEESSRITAMYADYRNKLLAGGTSTSYQLAKGVTYSNYDTVLQDSDLYQLLNNAKIDYGLGYVAQYLPGYKNTPIIACTRNLLDSNDSYLLIKDTLSADKVSQILSESSSSRPSGYIQMFEITGKDLREWLEYNASLYATQGTTFKNILASYVSKNPGVSTLLQEDYIYNWNGQYVFDGISYTVDLTKKARYASDGILLNPKNKRISSLTYNGTEVSDTQKFILVTDSGIPPLSFLSKDGEDSIKVYKDNETGKNITVNYIKKLSAFGSISVKADHNWKLTADAGYTFLLGVPKKIVTAVSAYSWNKGLAAETTSYSFLKGYLPSVTQTINIVAAQGRKEINNEPVPVLVSATSKSGIREMKYLPGKITSSKDPKWSSAAVIRNNTFTASQNGIYTLRVTDSKNNSATAYVTVDRYDPDILPSPMINRLTNRNTVFTGKAVPDATIRVTIGDDKYSSAIKSDGTFSITIKPPKAFSEITAYVEASGRKSGTVTANVRKTGPNAVQINTIRVFDNSITGTASPNTNVYVLIWTTVYVGRGQTQMYQDSDFYNPKYKIVETDIKANPDTGEYQIVLPTLKSNMKVYVFSVDRFGATSKSTMQVPVYY